MNRPWAGYYLTAYGLAVKHGFTGTELEWLKSLGVTIRYNGETKNLEWRSSAGDWLPLMTLAELQDGTVADTLAEASGYAENAGASAAAAASSAGAATERADAAIAAAEKAEAAQQGAVSASGTATVQAGIAVQAKTAAETAKGAAESSAASAASLNTFAQQAADNAQEAADRAEKNAFRAKEEASRALAEAERAKKIVGGDFATSTEVADEINKALATYYRTTRFVVAERDRGALSDYGITDEGTVNYNDGQYAPSVAIANMETRVDNVENKLDELLRAVNEVV